MLPNINQALNMKGKAMNILLKENPGMKIMSKIMMLFVPFLTLGIPKKILVAL